MNQIGFQANAEVTTWHYLLMIFVFTIIFSLVALMRAKIIPRLRSETKGSINRPYTVSVDKISPTAELYRIEDGQYSFLIISNQTNILLLDKTEVPNANG